MTGFTFQSLKPQDSLSNELRSVIRDNVCSSTPRGYLRKQRKKV